MKNFKQLLEDLGAMAANNTGAIPDKAVVTKKAAIRYKKKNSCCDSLNTGSRKIKSTM